MSDAASQPPLGRRERRKQEVRDRIYAAAQELFLKQGFANTTVDQITATADVAPATFFNHFHSKSAVLALMTTQVVDYLSALISAHLKRGGSTHDRFMSFIVHAADEISANRGVARDVVLELVRTEARPDEPPPYLVRVHEPFEEFVAEGQRSGEIRSDSSASFLAQMVVGMLNAAVSAWLADPHYPIESGLTQAAEFAWSSIRTPTADEGTTP